MDGWNYSPGTNPITDPTNAFIDISAPGKGIEILNGTGYSPNGAGTSDASPFVSALCGLMLSINLSLTPNEVYSIITHTSDKIGQYSYDANGWNRYMGYGRINAEDAVHVASGAPATPRGLTIGMGLKNLDLKKFYIMLKWNANIEPDFSLYEIWRKVGTGDWTEIGTSTTNQYNEFDYFYNGTVALYYKVRAKDTDNNYSFFSDVVNGNGTIAPKAGGEKEIEEKFIAEYSLSSNYPNPFNPSTTINYQIPNNNYVTLKVYDMLGNVVKTLIDGYKTQGNYSINFNASSLSNGIYFYQLKAGSFISTKKMLLLK